MPLPQRTNRSPWSQRSRTLRKRAWIRLKNEITSHACLLGGAYTTHDVVVEASWADIYFLSRARRGDLYNATVDTALYAYFSRCETLAREASERALPYEHRGMNELFEKLPNGNYRMRDAPLSHVEAEHRAFGGLSRHAWVENEIARLADSGDVSVSPCVTIDASYRYGVGLFATLPLDVLSISDLDLFVRDFWIRGERPFVVESSLMSYPASRQSESRSSNAVGEDPVDWVPAEEAAVSRRTVLARDEQAALGVSLDEDLAGREPLAPKRPRL